MYLGCASACLSIRRRKSWVAFYNKRLDRTWPSDCSRPLRDVEPINKFQTYHEAVVDRAVPSKRILDLSRSGGSRIFQERQTLKGSPTYYMANFAQKLHENEDILVDRSASLSSPPTPIRQCGGRWLSCITSRPSGQWEWCIWGWSCEKGHWRHNVDERNINVWWTMTSAYFVIHLSSFFLNNTNLTFLTYCSKSIKEFLNQQKIELPPVEIELTTATITGLQF